MWSHCAAVLALSVGLAPPVPAETPAPHPPADLPTPLLTPATPTQTAPTPAEPVPSGRPRRGDASPPAPPCPLTGSARRSAIVAERLLRRTSSPRSEFRESVAREETWR